MGGFRVSILVRVLILAGVFQARGGGRGKDLVVTRWNETIQRSVWVLSDGGFRVTIKHIWDGDCQPEQLCYLSWKLVFVVFGARVRTARDDLCWVWELQLHTACDRGCISIRQWKMKSFQQNLVWG